MGGIGSGGAREGAGRKPLDGDPRVHVSLTLPSGLISRIREEATRRQVSASGLITELLTKTWEK